MSTKSSQNWSSPELQSIITKLSPPQKSDLNEYQLNGNTITDVEEKENFFIEFALKKIKIKAVGYDIAWEAKKETNKTYSGIEYDLIERKDSTERVLQLLLVWTKQKAFLSSFVSLILLGIAFLSILQLSSVKPESKMWVKDSILLIALLLASSGGYYLILLLGFGQLTLRPIFLILSSFVYFFISNYELEEKLRDNGPGFQFLLPSWMRIEEVYLSVISLLLIVAVTIRLLVRKIEDSNFWENIENIYNKIPLLSRTSISHKMDYAPIWIFLTNKDQPNDPNSVQKNWKSNPKNWEINQIYYDRIHYMIGKIDQKQIQTFGIPNFEIRNSWHSFNRQIIDDNIIPTPYKKLAFIIEFMVLLALSYFHWGNPALIIIQTFISIILLVTWISLFNSPTYDFIQNSSRAILTPAKIVTLWNLTKPKARLIIKDKLINPFEDPNAWENGTWEKTKTPWYYGLGKFMLFIWNFVTELSIRTKLILNHIKKTIGKF